ncbi:MAG: cation:proton antiporter [Kineosporiaceae bacterium]
MDELLLAAVLLAGVVALTPLADHLQIPQPILLTLFGLGIALVPGLPDLAVDPDLILPVVLPPLLFAATQRTTAEQLRDRAGGVLLLAGGLTVATAAAVAVVAHLAGLSWAWACVLGALVSPPDPVAATAVARSLRLPERLVVLLEGEGLFNDAVALVMFELAVIAATGDGLNVPEGGLALLLAVGVGVAAGLALGALTRWVLDIVHDAPAETTITIAAPFVAYLGADELGGSGVLAVLCLGLFLRSRGHSAITSQGWLLGRAVWSYLDFLLTSLVFALLGFELLRVVSHSSTGAHTLGLTAGVIAVLVAVRGVWLFGSAAALGPVGRRRDVAAPDSPRELGVAVWAGMRGVVTVAAALSLPALGADGRALPQRQEVVLVALLTVLVTLVVQGLTLAPLIRRLGVGSDVDEAAEVAHLRRRAAEEALRRVREERHAHPDVVVAAVEEQLEGRLRAYERLERARDRTGDADRDAELDAGLRRALELAADAERSVVLRARHDGEVSPEVADTVLRDIESRAVRDLG